MVCSAGFSSLCCFGCFVVMLVICCGTGFSVARRVWQGMTEWWERFFAIPPIVFAPWECAGVMARGIRKFVRGSVLCGTRRFGFY